jgi:hypothetical protein
MSTNGHRPKAPGSTAARSAPPQARSVDTDSRTEDRRPEQFGGFSLGKVVATD